MFAIYVRVSEVGERNGESFGSPEEQEAAARAWAEREGVDVYFDEDECVELNVSGATAAEDRKLGTLIKRCEAGDLVGIVVRDERRFARDPIAGGVALDRLVECGARLKATWSGFDSANLTPESRMVFDIMMAIGKAERARNRLARVNGSQRAARQGYYLASRAPLGYAWSERRKRSDGSLGAGKLVLDPETCPLVVEAFERRASGESLRSIAEWLHGRGVKITKSGVRALVANRAYLGEATVPNGQGNVDVVKKAHDPLVTDDLWERANATGGTYQPRNGRWASQARLGGIVYCSGCGRRLSAVGGGSVRGVKVPYYNCTAEGCTARVGIRMELLDEHVHDLLQTALLRREPHVSAVMEGDDRYSRALEAVEQARQELETFVAEVRVTDVGKDAWVKGKEARQAALGLARKALRGVPAPKASRKKIPLSVPYEEAEPRLLREHNARFISRVVVKPVGRGRRVPVGERADVYLVGAEEPYVPVEPAFDPEVLAAVQAAHEDGS